MNFKEGARRLTLVICVLGASVGACLSYSLFLSINSQRARHDQFESLLTSPAVQKNIHLMKHGEQPDGAWLKYAHHGQDVWDAALAISGSREGWVVNEGGVGKIYFGPHEEVNSIATDEGVRLYPVQAPNRSVYLLLLIWPVIGFFLPWVVFKVVGWIVAGFAPTPQ